MNRLKACFNERRLPYSIKHNLPFLGTLPDCIIIGAQKAGTTSLYDNLGMHPNVWLPDCREINYFNANYGRGLGWYKARFPSKYVKFYEKQVASKPFITLESTPIYFIDINAPKRIKITLPDIKLIFLLRNPIDRAFSHWKMNKRRGFESLDFEQALVEEDARIEKDIQSMHSNPNFLLNNTCQLSLYSYCYRGLYFRRIQSWLETFSPSQILTIISEELWQKDGKEFNRTLDFLGLPAEDTITFKKTYGSSRNNLKISNEIRLHLEKTFEEDINLLEQYLGRKTNWL